MFAYFPAITASFSARVCLSFLLLLWWVEQRRCACYTERVGNGSTAGLKDNPPDHVFVDRDNYPKASSCSFFKRRVPLNHKRSVW